MTMRIGNRWRWVLLCGGVIACTNESPSGSDGTEDTTTMDATTGSTSTESGDATTSSAEVSTSTDDSGSSGSGESSSSTGEPHDPNEDIPPLDEEGCHGLYAQDIMPTFELTIHPTIWEQLEWEWNNGPANEDAGVETAPYHSLQEFRYGDIVITDASIRLRGNPTWWTPLPGDKMQFQIGFHTQDPEGRFLGLRRLALDAATFNRHMLRDRLALAVMRRVGIRAPCANHARVNVNGEYYGLFTNIEKLDEEFLERTMEDPTGDLWKRANWQLKTNEDTASLYRLNELRNAVDVTTLDYFFDIEQALRVYAAEAVIPDSDGAWAGGLNWYLYDDPHRGKFMLLPWDKDNTFERFDDEPDGDYPLNPDPFTWEKPTTHGRKFYDLALTDPANFALYIDIVDEVLHQGYDPDQMLAWIDEWSAQIEQAVLDDVNKPYSNNLYYNRLEDLREYVPQRYDFVDQWLACWQQGGVDDGTGHCVEL
ncbi:CotH kinase family protein [Paraliomyxa miuraensis]|uniref:CotH kinase family protein n=1 Tax=Paraliomyxa miuraensis TaxID=376150 RepID=UPI00224FD6FA|nr:CotH kinase family protein [Paraliomyxa miuraensis]MCX4245313.1 CotH kinase family protein [Paraliomyxa miuraensis]